MEARTTCAINPSSQHDTSILTRRGRSRQGLPLFFAVIVYGITSVSTFASEIDVLAKRAFDNARSIDDSNKARLAWDMIAFSCARAGRLKLAKQAVKENAMPDKLKEESVAALISAQAQGGRIEKALSDAEKIDDFDIRESAFYEVVTAQCRRGCPFEAYKIAKKRLKGGTLIRSYRWIAESLAWQSDLGEATELLKIIEDQQLKREARTAVATAKAGPSLPKASKSWITLRIREEVMGREKTSKQSRNAILAWTAARNGNKERARKYRSEVEDIRASIKNPLAVANRGFSLLLLALAASEVGNNKAADMLLGKVSELFGGKMSVAAKDLHSTLYAYVVTELDGVQRALNLFERNNTSEVVLPASAGKGVGVSLMKSNNVGGLKELLKDSGDAVFKVYLCSGAIDYLAIAGDRE